MRRTLGRLALAVVVVLAVVASAVAARTHAGPSQTNAFYSLFDLELLLVPVAGLAALAVLGRRPSRAPGLVGAGLSALALGVAFLTVFPIWLPSDNTILGTALLGGLLAMAGTGMALSGATVLGGRTVRSGLGVGLATGAVAFLLNTASGMVAPLAALHLPVILALAVLVGVLLLARPRLDALAAPCLLAALGAALTVGLLLARGPGDWATASDTVRLYGFPEIVLVVAAGLTTIDLSPETTDRGRAAALSGPPQSP